MDNLSPETAQSLQNLSAKDKADLNQFIQQESQKAQIQQTVHHHCAHTQLSDVEANIK